MRLLARDNLEARNNGYVGIIQCPDNYGQVRSNNKGPQNTWINAKRKWSRYA